MSNVHLSPRSDEPTALTSASHTRPPTDASVAVDVDRRLLRGARSAIGYLEDADLTGDDALVYVADARVRVDSLTARLDAQSNDGFTARFDVLHLALLVNGLFGVARYYAEGGQPVAADFHRERAAELLDALVDQHPEFLGTLRRIGGR